MAGTSASPGGQPPEASPPGDAPGKRPPGFFVFVVKYGLLTWGLGGGFTYWLVEVVGGADPAAAALYVLKLFPALGLAAGVALWFFGRVRGGPRRRG